MTTLLKRKIEQNENLFNNPTLLDYDSEPKRCKSLAALTEKHPKIENESREDKEEEGAGGGPLCEEIRSRALCVLRTLMQHIFALPFVRLGTDPVMKENCKDRVYLDDVCDNIESGGYNNLQEVISAVNQVFDSTTRICVGNLNFFGRKLFYKSEDLDIMATHLRKELESFHRREFSSMTSPLELRRSLSFNCLSEIIEKGESDDAIFQKLKARYENVPDCILLAKALDISLSQEVDLECIEEELKELELRHLNQPKYRVYKFFPSRQHDFATEKVHHSYIAGYQFHKMITKSTSAPIAMRTILNMSDAIESITYIENDALNSIYEQQRELFQQQGKVNENGKVDEMLLFHGTAVSSLDSILSSNFMVDAMPVQQNTANETRKKTMMFGRGVYFSEMPSVSLMYGNGLVLCKVMLGSCEVFKPQGSTPADIPDQFDSREIQAVDKQGVIHVVKNPAQILPYCVIQLKNQSLSSQFVKPNKPTSNVPTNTRVNCNPNFSKSVINPSSSNTSVPSNNGWTIINPKKSSSTSINKTYTAAETVSLHSVDTDQCDPEDVCSICLDKLSLAGFVFLTRCGHKFHRDCLVQVVEHQPCQMYVQCPNCQVIHGQKTGNMPANAQMMWIKQGVSLPGYSDCGLIVIKYHLTDGIQDETHPNPGKAYFAKSFPRHAFLPDNSKGNMVLKMLKTAFQRGLTFTIGRSITRGEDDCITWNGIHHKTLINSNGSGHGYPDPGYLDRVIEELGQFGIYTSDFQ